MHAGLEFIQQIITVVEFEDFRNGQEAHLHIHIHIVILLGAKGRKPGVSKCGVEGIVDDPIRQRLDRLYGSDASPQHPFFVKGDKAAPLLLQSRG